MKLLKFSFFAALSLLSVAAFAGYPVLSFIPPDVAAGLAGLGSVPLAGGLFKNRVMNIQPQVAASQTSVVTLACGPGAPTLDKLQFILSGGAFTVAHISAIRGYIGGREFYTEGTGTVHNARRTYLGLGPVNSELVLDFTEPNARSAIEQNLSALPLSLMPSLKFELDIGAATTPAITCLAHYRAPTNNPFIKKQKKITEGFNNTGEQTIFLPNGPSGGKISRIWIHESVAGNVTRAVLKARNAIGIDATRTELQNTQTSWGLTPQAGVLVLDFIEDGNLAGWFDTSMLTDVELILTGTAACTYTIYIEYLDPINRL